MPLATQFGQQRFDTEEAQRRGAFAPINWLTPLVA
jgi:hypothetical protein